LARARDYSETPQPRKFRAIWGNLHCGYENEPAGRKKPFLNLALAMVVSNTHRKIFAALSQILLSMSLTAWRATGEE
jgi:hypothetical protein